MMCHKQKAKDNGSKVVTIGCQIWLNRRGLIALLLGLALLAGVAWLENDFSPEALMCMFSTFAALLATLADRERS